MRFLNEVHKENYQFLHKIFNNISDRAYTAPLFIISGNNDLFSKYKNFINTTEKGFIIDIVKNEYDEDVPSFRKKGLSSSEIKLLCLCIQFYNDYDNTNIVSIMKNLDSENRKLCFSALDYYFPIY